MTQASDLTIICAGLFFMGVTLLILWMVVRGLRAERLGNPPPYLPDCFEDDYEPNEYEKSHWQEFLIMRAAALFESRRSGRWDGPPISVKWDRERIPPWTDAGIFAQHLEDEGERYGIHVRRV